MTDIYRIVKASEATPGDYWATDASHITVGVLVPVVLLGIGEFADRVGLKKSTIYVYHSTNKLPEPDLVVNGGNTALWFDSTVDRWKEER